MISDYKTTPFLFIIGSKASSNLTERVVVMERASGKLLTGPAAPTESTLADWLVKNQTFEVLQPGQSKNSSAAGMASK